MKKTIILLISIGVTLCTMTSCDPYTGSTNRIRMSEIGETKEVVYGTISNIQYGIAEADSNAGGTIIGAVAGGAAGSLWGGGRAQNVTTAGMAILGGIIGNQIDKAVSERHVAIISVKFKNTSKTIQVTQLVDPAHPLHIGQSVEVSIGSRGSRVRGLTR